MGAVTLAAVGSGLWDDFSIVDQIIEHQAITQPHAPAAEQYQRLLATYEKTWAYLSLLADLMEQG